MNISVIIPVLNEEKTIAATLRALLPLQPHEIIVVDGGSGDRSREICRQLGAQVLSSERGRARQMNHGARYATRRRFAVSPCRYPTAGRRRFADIAERSRDPRCLGGRFDVELEGGHWMLKIIGALDQLPFARDESRHRRSGAVSCGAKSSSAWVAIRTFL